MRTPASRRSDRNDLRSRRGRRSPSPVRRPRNARSSGRRYARRAAPSTRHQRRAVAHREAVGACRSLESHNSRAIRGNDIGHQGQRSVTAPARNARAEQLRASIVHCVVLRLAKWQRADGAGAGNSGAKHDAQESRSIGRRALELDAIANPRAAGDRLEIAACTSDAARASSNLMESAPRSIAINRRWS